MEEFDSRVEEFDGRVEELECHRGAGTIFFFGGGAKMLICLVIAKI